VPNLHFTDLAIRNLKAPLKGQVDYWDTLKGFGLRVGTQRKTFIVMAGPVRSRRTIGPYPALSLQEARKQAQKLISEMKETPVGMMPPPLLSDALETFFATHCATLRPGSAYQLRRLLKRLPALDITSHQIDKLLDGIEKPSERLHAFRAFRVFYRWCVRRKYLRDSPMEGMSSPGKDTIRDRLLTSEEIQKIWRVAPPFVKLLITTGQRWNQIASLRWSWIENEAIRFPATIMKNNLEHTLPVSSLTLSLLSTIPKEGHLLFP
jgi:hypothetical protein